MNMKMKMKIMKIKMNMNMKIKMKMMIKIKILLYPHEYAKTVDQNERNIIIKKLNDNLDKIIDKSKSFEDQTESLKS